MVELKSDKTDNVRIN